MLYSCTHMATVGVKGFADIFVSNSYVMCRTVGSLICERRSQRRQRMFRAPSPPVERTYSHRRRRRGGSAASAADDELAAESDRRTRMTMRMKPTRIVSLSAWCRRDDDDVAGQSAAAGDGVSLTEQRKLPTHVELSAIGHHDHDRHQRREKCPIKEWPSGRVCSSVTAAGQAWLILPSVTSNVLLRKTTTLHWHGKGH